MIRVHLSGIYKGNDNGQFVTLELLSATSKCMLSIRHYHFSSLRLVTGTKKIIDYWYDLPLPERIYNSHYGNGVPAMFTSKGCPAER